MPSGNESNLEIEIESIEELSQSDILRYLESKMHIPADGVRGEKGESGSDGKDGSDGEAGKDGLRGNIGPRGKDGVNGANGIIGRDGSDGSPGPTGPMGPIGKQGPRGEKGEQGNHGKLGPMPKHEVENTQDGKRIRFEKRLGVWGEWVDFPRIQYFGIGGGSGINGNEIRTIISDELLGLNDDDILVDASSGSVTITLPPVASSGKKKYNIKKIDATGNTVTIVGPIDGDLNKVISMQWTSLTLKSNALRWYIT